MSHAPGMPRDVHELMEARVAGLYRCDGRGRTVAVNQWDGGRPPRFHLARTARGHVCRVREDVSGSVCAGLLRLTAAEPPLADPSSPPAKQSDYIALLCGDGEPPEMAAGPVYRFALAPGVAGITDSVSYSTRVIGPANAHLLRHGLADWIPDVPHRQPMVVSVERGRAVSVCASVRITACTHEAGVETLPAYRGRGHAAAASAAWAREVQRRGVPTCFYSTSWDNVSSRRVAQRLALTLIGVDFSIT